MCYPMSDEEYDGNLSDMRGEALRPAPSEEGHPRFGEVETWPGEPAHGPAPRPVVRLLPPR